ncbi:MAG: efflux RND transporter periplasmic adaptor subunit [Hyphomicrobiaceae bacterium]
MCKKLFDGFRRGFVLASTVLIVGCESNEVAAPLEHARPVKTIVIPEAEVSGIRKFPARIESTKRAKVSFRVSGKLKTLPVTEGQRLKQDEVIATLDQTDFKLAVDDRQAAYLRAKKDYDRAVPLAEKGIVTRREFDRREAEMKRTLAALRHAEKELEYTVLKAPFDGEVSNRLVQNFEEIQAKQPVVELRDILALEVKFDVPEQIMIRVAQDSETANSEPEVLVSFDAAPGQKYKLVYREVATKADPATRTFEATYTLRAPSDLAILPGMSANVTVDLSSYVASEPGIYVPVAAVMSTNELKGRVWVVEEDTMTLSPRRVEVGTLSGNSIAVVSGLAAGDRIVVAGAPFLNEGMKVTLMPMPEQALERADDVTLRRDAERQVERTGSAE